MNVVVGTELSSKPLLLVAGLGELGRALGDRLGHHWEVRYVDIDDSLAGSTSLELVVGDATSLLVLRRAGADKARAVLAATRSDEVNLEFCRLAKMHFGIPEGERSMPERSSRPASLIFLTK